jgi:glycosyltransferase involved in cell wall biosynthesis
MKVSVIIPCYNDGKFLQNAVSSVLNIKSPGIELIIVNDGSSDPETLQILTNYINKDIKVLSHENHGVSYSRNRGIREAKGEYILPLDADNVIKLRYIEQGIKYLDSGQFDIVYARPYFLGENLPERKFDTHGFTGQKLFWDNYIDTCALYRKSVWESVGGYDDKMPCQGQEDWEFWVNCYLSGFRFKYIDEELFGYTIRTGSLVGELSENERTLCHDYIVKKHAVAMLSSLKPIYDTYQKQQRNYLKTSLKYLVKPITERFDRKPSPANT